MNTENARNRGYQKIEGAARAFNFDFRGKTVLDIGSSTGGFTEYALDHGAAKVIAVEKGTNQMLPYLRDNPRVELHEKTDIFDVVAGPAGRGPMKEFICAPDVVLADVSFIPLTKILKYAKMNLSRGNTDFLVMLKPQFETTNPNDLNRGIVKNETIRRRIIKNFETWLKTNGFIVINKKDNALAGKHGNIERFYHLRLAK